MVEMKIGKLSPKVPIQKTMNRIVFRSDRLATQRNPSIKPWLVHRAFGLTCGSAVRSKQSEKSTAANDAALIRKTQAEPTAAIKTPATAGPINLAALNDVEFRATAFDKSASLTSSVTRSGEQVYQTP